MKKKMTKQTTANKQKPMGKVTFTQPIPFEMLDKVARIEYASAVMKEIAGLFFLFLAQERKYCEERGISPMEVCEHMSHNLLSFARSEVISLTEHKVWPEYDTKKQYNYNPLAKNRKTPKNFSPERLIADGMSRLYMDAIMASQPWRGHYTEKVVNKPKHCKKPIVRAIVEEYARGKFIKAKREELVG